MRVTLVSLNTLLQLWLPSQTLARLSTAPQPIDIQIESQQTRMALCLNFILHHEDCSTRI
jgi:hypothetical protein